MHKETRVNFRMHENEIQNWAGLIQFHTLTGEHPRFGQPGTYISFHLIIHSVLFVKVPMQRSYWCLHQQLETLKNDGSLIVLSKDSVDFRVTGSAEVALCLAEKSKITLLFWLCTMENGHRKPFYKVCWDVFAGISDGRCQVLEFSVVWGRRSYTSQVRMNIHERAWSLHTLGETAKPLLRSIVHL